MRTIEIDARAADLLEARARERDMSVADLVADLAFASDALPPDLQTLRETGQGPWSPEALARDGRALAEFRQTRRGAPWGEVRNWLRSWGDEDEQGPPRPRAT